MLAFVGALELPTASRQANSSRHERLPASLYLCVCVAPPPHTCRYLLHHRPCSSALKDFTIGTFFNRVIDDGKASDNTRHMAQHKVTGEPFLLPPEQIRRVVLCTGQIYYQLSR